MVGSRSMLAAVALCLAMPMTAVPVAAQTAPATHERLVPLEGGQNFRDIGGYVGVGGKTVRWGMVYRSGSMHYLTAADFAALRARGIKAVVDFRSPGERNAEPVAWPADAAPRIFTAEQRIVANPMLAKLFAPGQSVEAMRQGMATLYREIPFQLAGQYRTLFAELRDGDVPLVFNCTAGKDRTGVAAALLLTLLGVDRETVIADYLLSNAHYKPKPMTFAGGNGRPALSPEAISFLSGVDRSLIEAAFAGIEERPGGMDAYVRDQLGLSQADVATLRARYLE